MSPQQISLGRGLSDQTLVVTVQLSRPWRVRIRLALMLMRMATKLLGCGFRVEKDASAD